MKRLAKIALLALALFVITSLAFGSGLAVGRSDRALEANAAAASPMCQLAGPDGGETTAPCKSAAAATDGPEDFDTFWQAWDIVQEHFVDREALDEDELEYGAIRGLVESLGDEGHTIFLSPEDVARQQSEIQGKYSGIGALLGVRDGLPVIVAPFDGSPAEQAGVKAGDLIIEVDGEDVTTWMLGEIVDVIRGQDGSKVVLTLLRPDEGQSYEFAITRGEITAPAATWSMLPGTEVALIRLSQFSANAYEEMATSVREAHAEGARALILDVRNNPGGLLEQVVKVSSIFLEDGNVLQQEDAEGRRRGYPVLPVGTTTEIPLVVLANRGSASSSEILAGAMQDHERGQVVGETTFGTGTVLEPFALDDGSGLMLGTSQWLTSNGRLIRKHGIEPDVTLELQMSTDLLDPMEAEELTATGLWEIEDTQLLKALELLEIQPTN